MTSENKKNWEKSIKKWIVHILFGASIGKYKEKTTGELADRILKGIKQFIAKELAKKDKEFIEILNGLKMFEKIYGKTISQMIGEETPTGVAIRIADKDKLSVDGYNLAVKELNNKIKQIKQKYAK